MGKIHKSIGGKISRLYKDLQIGENNKISIQIERRIWELNGFQNSLLRFISNYEESLNKCFRCKKKIVESNGFSFYSKEDKKHFWSCNECFNKALDNFES